MKKRYLVIQGYLGDFLVLLIQALSIYLFVNNNLVSSTKGVSPYINDNHYSIVFGSEKYPLPGCAVCNVEYFNLPMGLNQIKNNYKKKNNPCK